MDKLLYFFGLAKIFVDYVINCLSAQLPCQVRKPAQIILRRNTEAFFSRDFPALCEFIECDCLDILLEGDCMDVCVRYDINFLQPPYFFLYCFKCFLRRAKLVSLGGIDYLL